MLMLPSVLADYGDMMGGYGMMGGTGWFGMLLLGLLYLAIGAFVFSVVFWLTHNWLVKGKHKNR
ncbi:MAG: hypothetical protein V1729_03835 [Candidatus Woesearchaeota archaeon]